VSARSIKLVALLFCWASLCGKPAASQEQKVWSWFTSCGTEALVLQLILDGKPLYDVLLGISVSDGRVVYMNAIHVAYPERRTRPRLKKVSS
jgi:hypothetical protein